MGLIFCLTNVATVFSTVLNKILELNFFFFAEFSSLSSSMSSPAPPRLSFTQSLSQVQVCTRLPSTVLLIGIRYG
jgi:hypothetical protein